MNELLWYVPGFLLSLIFFSIGAILCAEMDKMMVDFQNLTKALQNKVNPYWYTYNPLAKWKDGKWGTERAYNVLFLKYFNIKTTWLTDNCNDGWHFLKSCKIIAYSISVVFSLSDLREAVTLQFWIVRIVMTILLGMFWNIAFNKRLNYK